MLSPTRSFQSVVTELVDGLRNGEIALRDEPARGQEAPPSKRPVAIEDDFERFSVDQLHKLLVWLEFVDREVKPEVEWLLRQGLSPDESARHAARLRKVLARSKEQLECLHTNRNP